MGWSANDSWGGGADTSGGDDWNSGGGGGDWGGGDTSGTYLITFQILSHTRCRPGPSRIQMSD